MRESGSLRKKTFPKNYASKASFHVFRKLLTAMLIYEMKKNAKMSIEEKSRSH